MVRVFFTALWLQARRTGDMTATTSWRKAFFGALAFSSGVGVGISSLSISRWARQSSKTQRACSRASPRVSAAVKQLSRSGKKTSYTSPSHGENTAGYTYRSGSFAMLPPSFALALWHRGIGRSGWCSLSPNRFLMASSTPLVLFPGIGKPLSPGPGLDADQWRLLPRVSLRRLPAVPGR